MGKILVVGGAGYIGSHVLLALKANGFDAVTLDNLSAGHAQAVRHGALVVGDTADRGVLYKVFSQHRIDCVMQFAAHIEVGESVQLPIKYYHNKKDKEYDYSENIQRRHFARQPLRCHQDANEINYSCENQNTHQANAWRRMVSTRHAL